MRRIAKKAAALTAVGLAAAGAAVLPAATARADPGFLCPRAVGVCAWTRPGGTGELRILFGDEPFIEPPVRSALNQTAGTWCFYRRPFHTGEERREVQPFETVHEFGFAAHSARRGRCR